MKFAEHLSAHITPEWRKQYIQYEVRRGRRSRAEPSRFQPGRAGSSRAGLQPQPLSLSLRRERLRQLRDRLAPPGPADLPSPPPPQRAGLTDVRAAEPGWRRFEPSGPAALAVSGSHPLAPEPAGRPALGLLPRKPRPHLL